jgi:L-ribulose-5-phosphate 4-epimerase
MLDDLKKTVYRENLNLVKHGLVLFTWGNVSAFDRQSGLVVIKPSGLSYETMSYKDMVVVDLDGTVREGNCKPSSDTPTHIEIYKAFGAQGVVHTHSEWATIWAQAGKKIPYLGTTHADNFSGDIPVTRKLTEEEILGAYEKETGKVIVETFKHLDPYSIQAVLVNNHGPFTWGDSAEKAVENAAVLEYISKMAYYTLDIDKSATMDETLLNKHFKRKHGASAYYGQTNG